MLKGMLFFRGTTNQEFFKRVAEVMKIWPKEKVYYDLKFRCVGLNCLTKSFTVVRWVDIKKKG